MSQPSPDGTDHKHAKAFSCLRCFERKVKCDKNHPCNNCVRGNVDCHFRIPSAPRRKKKTGGGTEALLDRLKRAEDLLRTKGILVDSETETRSPPQRQVSSSTTALRHDFGNKLSFDPVNDQVEGPLGKGTTSYESVFQPSYAQLITDKTGSKSRFIDNNLWSTVNGEFRDPQDALDDSSSDEDDGDTLAEDDDTGFVLGLTPSSTRVSHLHPSQDTIFKLWSLFLENVNPLTKVIHVPSLQEKLVAASQDVSNIGRGLEALMFSIYLCAITSIDDIECEKTFGEARRDLLSRFRQGCRKSLSKARFLGTADLQVLQAFVLYLLMMREDYDSREMWALAGVAKRLAQSIGVHRDGTLLGVPPFETELRRRIWWQITVLDFRSAELTGSGRFGESDMGDTHVPMNVDDKDLWPGMTETPVNQVRPTEMIVCLLRAEFGSFWRGKLKLMGEMNLTPKDFFASTPSLTQLRELGQNLDDRDSFVNELETILHEKFLKYCDLTDPLQYLATIIGKTGPNLMRLMAHHPKRYSDERKIPLEERQLLWNISIKCLQSDNSCHSAGQLKKFAWHIRIHFQWQAMIYLLGELRKQTRGTDVDLAWKVVDESWEHHTELITNYKKPIHAAMGELCLKAYEAREQGLREELTEKTAQGVFVLPLSTPGYIQMLRQQRAMPRRKESKMTPPPLTTNASTTSMVADNFIPDGSGFAYNTYAQPGGVEQSSMNMPWSSAAAPNDFACVQPMMTYEPNAMWTTDLSGGDVQMDWNQWDSLIQEFDLGAKGQNGMAL